MFSDVDRAPDPDRAVAYLEATAESLAGMKQQMLTRLRVEPGERVLDVGCGAGHDLVSLDELDAEVFGIDRSAHMIAESARRCPHASVVRGDAAALPYSTGAFDACRIERVLQHVHDPLVVLREAARVVRPEGRVVLFEPDWGSLAIDSNDAATQSAVTNAVMAGVRHPRAGLQLRALLVAAGFVVEDVIVDVGRYTSLDFVRRFVDLAVVQARAASSGLLRADEFTRWVDEMDDRSQAGRFQGTLNRMIAVARVAPR